MSSRMASSLLPLPDANCRFTPARKLIVAQAVRSGQITHSFAIDRWQLSFDELGRWMAGQVYLTKPKQVVRLVIEPVIRKVLR